MSIQARFIPSTTSLPLAEVISAFSYALDLTEGQPAGHCIRSCWIGMHVGKLLGLPDEQLWNLYYTLLLKDAGCSSNAARLCQLYGSDELNVKNDYKLVDSQNLLAVAGFVLGHAGSNDPFLKKLKRWFYLASNGDNLTDELVSTRCERGAEIALKLGFNEDIANSIRHLDEHWNGKGHPYHLQHDAIPLASQIALLSQVCDVFFKVGGASAALNELRNRAGTWFNPDLVSLCSHLEHDAEFWAVLGSETVEQAVNQLEPGEHTMLVDEDRLDSITEAFGMVVDVKSPFTHDHSTRVAGFSAAIATQFDFDPQRIRWLKRAAYLHDIGKLGVSNTILDKPGKLEEEEWQQIKQHPVHTALILGHLKPFADIAALSAAHHEKLDGSGYPLGLKGKQISLETRIITICDIFDALTAARPYREALSTEKSLRIIEGQTGWAIDSACFEALQHYVRKSGM